MGDSFDSSVVLLNDVVEVFVLAHQDVNTGISLDAFNGGRIPRFNRFAQYMAGHFDSALGDAAEVGNADRCVHESGHRIHKTFGLAQEKMKYLPYQNGRLDNVIGVQQWPASGCGLGWVPLLNRFFSESDRDVTAPTQCVVVFGPVGHLIFGLGEFGAALLATFVGHGLSRSVKLTRVMPVRWAIGQISDLFNNALNGKAMYQRTQVNITSSG
ncbi:hypothetical protein RAE21_19020 [Rhodoferax sp. TBRC 17198]|nr:hypothetical protein [Rhodoferax sp. TBRC 17198]MDT7524442.1 hypothetical protein [Rhodoferax sp. TBRC 17198]